MIQDGDSLYIPVYINMIKTGTVCQMPTEQSLVPQKRKASKQCSRPSPATKIRNRAGFCSNPKPYGTFQTREGQPFVLVIEAILSQSVQRMHRKLSKTNSKASINLVVCHKESY